jgi:hypothetical protein
MLKSPKMRRRRGRGHSMRNWPAGGWVIELNLEIEPKKWVKRGERFNISERAYFRTFLMGRHSKWRQILE